jgi:hypothetical protein
MVKPRNIAGFLVQESPENMDLTAMIMPKFKRLLMGYLLMG